MAKARSTEGSQPIAKVKTLIFEQSSKFDKENNAYRASIYVPEHNITINVQVSHKVYKSKDKGTPLLFGSAAVFNASSSNSKSRR